jgi:hypothetical protein
MSPAIAVKERPILFSAQMVRDIRARLKDQDAADHQAGARDWANMTAEKRTAALAKAVNKAAALKGRQRPAKVGILGGFWKLGPSDSSLASD